MSLEYRIGDVFERLAEIPDGSIDLIVTSPPFLALRSYLPADHPDKHREIGSESTPADFLDTLLALTAEWGRVLAPHGSLCVELGDTYSGAGGVPSDAGKTYHNRNNGIFDGGQFVIRTRGETTPGGIGWPLAKSLTGIPTLYPWSLAYGRNLLTGQPSPAGQWRIRNLIVWARPNPPVGALGDKFRPATSYITVACRSAKRYFDLDAVRGPGSPNTHARLAKGVDSRPNDTKVPAEGNRDTLAIIEGDGGAPPLDWHADHHPEDGDWLWKLSTQPFIGSAKTVRWERVEAGAPGDDIRRIASADCPRHGDLPGQVPKALRDAHVADQSNRTQRNGDHLELALDLVGATSDASRDRSDSIPASTTATPDPQCSPAATTRSTPFRRTAHALATTRPDTPSARTAADTARTSASPESSAPGRDSGESSNGSDGSPASLDTQTPDGIADIPRSERPCTCSFERKIVESTSHYATFPMALPKRLIEAMCPLRVCTQCGKPSERITSTEQLDTGRTTNGSKARDRAESFAGTTYATRPSAGRIAATTHGAPATYSTRSPAAAPPSKRHKP
jgi:hypothetical protein